jgi:hypothetical protein
VDLFKRTGRAFQVLADRQSNPVLQKAAAEIAGISADPSPEDLQRVLADLKSAIGDNSASGQNPGAPGGENPVTPAINTASPGGQ